MTQYTGQVAETPFYMYKAVAKNYNPIIAGQDLSGNTVKFKVWQYAGAALDIDDAAIAVYSSPNTELGIALTASQTNLSYARGWYSIHDETDDFILLHGPLIVLEVPYS